MEARAKSPTKAIIGGSALSAALMAIAMASLSTDVSYVPATLVTWFVLAFAANAIAAATFGLLWHSFAYRRGWRGVLAYALPGAICGALAALVVIGLPTLGSGEFGFLVLLASGIGVALGSLTGIFAWLIRRPDRDAPANPPTPTS